MELPTSGHINLKALEKSPTAFRAQLNVMLPGVIELIDLTASGALNPEQTAEVLNILGAQNNHDALLIWNRRLKELITAATEAETNQ